MAGGLESFEAVIFDLDGTLVATDRFWPDAARAGALKAFRELGIERDMPSAEDWMGMVGLPLEEGFDQVFTDLEPGQRKAVLDRCVEEEHRLLSDGRAGLLPGVLETLQALKARGLSIGVASNCSQSYLDAMLDGLGLGQWVDEARCLHSPGIRNKADMIEELLIEFRTRRAVMVGDRDGDRIAGWANGLPHVHLTRGYAQSGEAVPAEAILGGMDALIPCLVGRMDAVRSALDDAALGSAASGLGGGSGGVLGLCGPPASGKAWLVADMVREMRGRGFSVRTVDADAFLDFDSEGTPAWGSLDWLSELGATSPRGHPDRAGSGDTNPVDWVLVHGALLLEPLVLRALDRVGVVSGSWPVCERRLRGGHPLSFATGQDALARGRALWDAAQAQRDRTPPGAVAHFQCSGDNWLTLQPAGDAGTEGPR